MNNSPSRLTLKSFLRKQYAIFFVSLASTFFIASLLYSIKGSWTQHLNECQQIERRLNDIDEVLAREAVIGSNETLNFELSKLKNEFALTNINFQKSRDFSNSNDCRVHANGYSLSHQVLFGADPVGFVGLNKSDSIFGKTDLTSILFPIILGCLLTVLLFNFLRTRFESAIVTPVLELSEKMSATTDNFDINISSDLAEYKNLQLTLNSMLKRNREAADRIRMLEIAEELAKLSSQVAHDIRSPLTALNIALSDLGNVDQEKRSIVQKAASRINDIANDLLKNYKSKFSTAADITELAMSSSTSPVQVQISKVLESVYEEAKLIVPSQISLKLDLIGPVDAVCELNVSDLSRALSNLLNNSFEAFDTGGTVTLALRNASADIAIIVNDNGRGISPDVLSVLGTRPISKGKGLSSSGSGIGFLAAKNAIQSMGGKLDVQSRVGIGTTVTITLPRARRPY